MTRSGDKNGNGAAHRRWLQRPMVIPIALALAIGLPAISIAWTGGALVERVGNNERRIDTIEKNIEKRLDQLLQLRKHIEIVLRRGVAVFEPEIEEVAKNVEDTARFSHMLKQPEQALPTTLFPVVIVDGKMDIRKEVCRAGHVR